MFLGIMKVGAIAKRHARRIEVTPPLPDDFDEAAYLKRNRDVAAAVAKGRWVSGAAHWALHGRLERRSYRAAQGEKDLPETFDSKRYILLNPDVALAIDKGQYQDAEDHWLKAGRYENRKLVADLPEDFDEATYLRVRPDVMEAIKSGAYPSGAQHWRLNGHFERRHWRDGSSDVADVVDVVPPDFDASVYLRLHRDVAAAVADGSCRSAQDHWLTNGRSEGRRFLVGLPDDFDEDAYLKIYPDVMESVKAGGFKSGADHWRRRGVFEDRRWTTDFDPDRHLPQDFDAQSYLLLNRDVADAVAGGSFLSPGDHWLKAGRAEGRRYLSDLPLDFDGEAYLQLYPDVAASIKAGVFRSPEQHWRRRGSLEGRQSAASPMERIQVEAYAKLYPDVAAAYENSESGFLEHWRQHGAREGRVPFGFLPYKGRTTSRAFWEKHDGITFYGFFDMKTGLGTAARGYRTALLKAGVPVTSVTVRETFETTPDVRAGADGASIGKLNKVNLFHINADMVHRFFYDHRLHLLNDAYNIGIWVWELAHFRQDWASAFGGFDEIWVPSEFCRASISAISPIPVVVMPHVVSLPSPERLVPRGHFRLSDDVFVFGCIFDVGSLMDRKNPQAVIHAFIEAFGSRTDVLLAIKYHSAHHNPQGILLLHALAEGRDNIRFFGAIWDEAELLSFKSVIDCYVSAHRSEGFGLNIAEAMLLGKPVIATRYSGNVDFCTDDNSYRVAHRLTEVARQTGPYPKGTTWAEPDVTDLARQMSAVRNDPGTANARGTAARAEIQENYGAEQIADRMRRRFDEIEVFRSPPRFLVDWKSGADFTYRFHDDHPVKISVIVPVYNIDGDLLEKCIQSVVLQTHRNWELVLHDDGSTNMDTLAVLRRYKGTDDRIRISLGSENEGIAGATNAALALCSGDFIAFLDNDDELAVDALAEVAKAILANPTVDLLYTDEDKIDPDGSYCDHYYKPDWSPEHLESNGYFLHMQVARRSLVLEVGGMRPAFSGAQDFDLSLRLSRVARMIVHVPKVLYHWRKIPGSAAAVVDAKPEALERAKEALADHVRASRRDAIVTEGMALGLMRIRDRIPEGTPVTLLILTDNRSAEVQNRGTINLFDNFVQSILEKTQTVCDIRIVAVDNGNLNERQRQNIKNNNGSVVSYLGPRSPFSYPKKINFALPHVETELLIILNDDMEVISPEWVDSLVELAQRPTSGIVGARLLYPDNRIQHCGMIFGINDQVAHIFHLSNSDQIGYNGFTHIVRNYLALTGACHATRMSLLNELGGFDEAFAIDFNDVDLCLRAHAVGYRNIYTPFATLYHFEGTTLKRSEAAQTEYRAFYKKWRQYFDYDPYYNPNLTRKRHDFTAAP